jgi:cyclase
MLRTRFIPVLLLKNDSLVKTVNFKNLSYIGDPVNTVRIFNELEVDELIFLDIDATPNNAEPNFKILSEIANECFMPLSYGGGIRNFDTVKKIMDIGFEKVVLNSITHKDLQLISRIVEHYGSQAVVVSIDVKKNLWGKNQVWSDSGSINRKKNPIEWAKLLEENGVGEIFLTSIDREGTWSGFDIALTRSIADVVNVPVIAHGGAGNIKHIIDVIENGNASAVALGSMVVYQQKGMGVLINFPDSKLLNSISEIRKV